MNEPELSTPHSPRRRRFYRIPGHQTYHRDRACSYLAATIRRGRGDRLAFLAPEPGAGNDLMLASGAHLNECPRCGV